MWMQCVAVHLRAAIFQNVSPSWYNGQRHCNVKRTNCSSLKICSATLHHWYAQLQFTVSLTGTSSFCSIHCLLNIYIKNIFNFIFRQKKKNLVGLGDDLATALWTQNNPFEVTFTYLVSASPIHTVCNTRRLSTVMMQLTVCFGLTNMWLSDPHAHQNCVEWILGSRFRASYYYIYK
jgi:hypothetical protein